MKTAFREYHQYTKEEFKKLWEDCIFVFDTNTLLNMYRYSRQTVEKYFAVLFELKSKNKLWIPHQVGYEFFENRICVISDYEKSYDEILGILNSTKDSVDKKYKNHPFLDWEEVKDKIEQGLKLVIDDINVKKKKHPKWLEKDEILEKINEIFNDNVGKEYDLKKLTDIKKEGEERYSKKIPPGFKDSKKPDNEKFGDLILWKQIIDKAKEIQKPIIFISGDVKEDWWLEKDGKRIMPLPQLKKEMFTEAKVDFHIYTADKFLEHYQQEYAKQAIDKVLIDEVRKIRELEEKKLMRIRRQPINYSLHERNILEHEFFERSYYIFRELKEILKDLIHFNIHPKYLDEIQFLSHKLEGIIEKNSFKDSQSKHNMQYRHILTRIKQIIFELLHSEEYREETKNHLMLMLGTIDNIIENNREIFVQGYKN